MEGDGPMDGSILRFNAASARKMNAVGAQLQKEASVRARVQHPLSPHLSIFRNPQVKSSKRVLSAWQQVAR